MEERVEERMEERVEEKMEERVEERMEERVEEKMEERVEERMEERVEEKMEERFSLIIVQIVFVLLPKMSQSSRSLSAVVLPLLLLLLGLLIFLPCPSSARHFRRFLLFSTANPIILHTDDDNNDQPEDMLIREQQRRMKVRDEDEAVLARHSKQRSQHDDIRLSLNDLWKRGGDFCGCNMGCFYHSAGQCASCCSLGLR
uniref:Uncharacterized protein n=1 Tax=Globodera rostochiensis TaxID=31243 RepID=A0A914GYL9_GLORO